MATLGTFVDGVDLSAAELNAIGTWTTFTPSWNNLTVGNGTNLGRYVQLNDLIIVNYELTFGTTTSVTGNVGVSCPSGLTPVRVSSLSVVMEDSGTRYYPGSAVNIATLGRFELIHGESGNQGLMNSTNPFTWVTGDDIVITGAYAI